MEYFHEFLRSIHIGAGFIGLVAFWIPLFARKGAKVHVLAGKVFKYCAYLVLGAAAIGLAIYFAQVIREGQSWANSQVAFLVFLSYLTYVTWMSINYGLQVLSAKRDLTVLNTPANRMMARVAIASSVSLVAYAVIMSPSNKILLFALSPIGFFGGLDVLKAIGGKLQERKAWFYEHMGNMIGCGIAFHTAFAVFGSRFIFETTLPGWTQVIPWVLPAAIGIPASFIWKNYYLRKFRDGKYSQAAEASAA